MLPLQVLAHLVRKQVPANVFARDTPDVAPEAKSYRVLQAIYSYEKGNRPNYLDSAVVAGPRFLQSQVNGPSAEAPRRAREFAYITPAANEVACETNHDTSYGYSFQDQGRFLELAPKAQTLLHW